MSATKTLPWSPALSRRRFLQTLAAGSMVLASRANAMALVRDPAALDFEPNLWVAIAPDGAVSILAHRSEMGTGIRTALPMVVADELGADWDRVEIRQAIGDARLGSQNTDGSRSIRRFFEPMRVAGATVRTMLERAAAQIWGVDAAQCRASNHAVAGPDGQSLDFGELVAVAATLPVPAEDELSFLAPEERRYIGRDLPIADIDGIVTGQAGFGIDARREGQVFAMIERSPVLGGDVASFDDTATRAVPGVLDVLELPSFEAPHGFQALGGVAVVAENTWAALRGRRALQVEWTASEHDGYDSRKFARDLKAAASAPGKVWREEGDVDGAFAAAGEDAVITADYYAPHLAHAPMEPPCAVAEVTKDASGKVVAVEAWAPTQNPQAGQEQLAATFGIEMSEITVHVTLLGGGFGRKSKPDYIVEAALLADRLDRPVHVTWTREDDIRHDYYHTVAAVHMEATLGDDGMPSAWLQRSAYPSIFSTFAPNFTQATSMEHGLGFTDIPYALPNLRVESGESEHHVRIGWLRSVAHIYHAFGVCSFPDELAHAAGRDPLEYLMNLLGDPRIVSLDGVEYPNHDEPLERYPIDVGRLRHVTERVAELANWGRRLPRGRAQGIACHRSFLSYCANVVEVEVTPDGQLSIPRVHVVLDAGTVVHPDRVRSQLEGAAVFGASLALYGEITASRGSIDQSNFHDYPMTRIYDAPREITVEIVESDELPAGVGEVGVPPFAPALCNAIFAATGKRVRELPLSRHDLSWS